MRSYALCFSLFVNKERSAAIYIKVIIFLFYFVYLGQRPIIIEVVRQPKRIDYFIGRIDRKVEGPTVQPCQDRNICFHKHA